MMISFNNDANLGKFKGFKKHDAKQVDDIEG